MPGGYVCRFECDREEFGDNVKHTAEYFFLFKIGFGHGIVKIEFLFFEFFTVVSHIIPGKIIDTVCFFGIGFQLFKFILCLRQRRIGKIVEKAQNLFLALGITCHQCIGRIVLEPEQFGFFLFEGKDPVDHFSILRCSCTVGFGELFSVFTVRTIGHIGKIAGDLQGKFINGFAVDLFFGRVDIGLRHTCDIFFILNDEFVGIGGIEQVL